MQAVDEPELVELLGSGSTFDVHRARLGPAGTRVIIKQASANANRVEAAARLNNEFFIFHDLDLPGIVAPSQWLDTAKGPVLVFPDHGLSALSKRKGKPLKPKKLEQLAIKIANLLTTLHNAGIIHRDINPSNIVASNDLKDVRLIDLCLAVKAIDIDDGAAEHSSFDTNQGTPRYSAPEQSGRMNRQTDHRSDLYSLGVTLYELATGKPPFNDDDPAALIHRHLTETPPSVRDFNPNISEYFSDAIMRLLEKNPEDRFQSAASFEAEVSNGGARKTSSTFTIPNKLYGREELLAELSADLAKGMKGPSRMIRVAGPSGNGKSALISKLVGPAVASGAHFVQGKFEQFDQSRPYGAFLQVFDMLLRRILSQSAERVQRWRTRLLDALSPNGQVLLDILPDYEKLIDSQPTVPELGLSEAQIRTSIVFRRFVGALASSEEPLFVFLDDLQWSDPASRWLIDLLLNDNQIKNLTIIVAYRDNEVGASHPVTQLFANLNENQPLDPVILVEPLSADAVHDMVADCLGETKELSAHLAQIIMAKTAGNPFFIRQFLFALVRKKYVAFSAKFGRWVWDEDRAATEKISDNVADMVVERILELPQDTQDVVKLAACFGNKFSATDITLASEASTEATIKALTPAIQEQIIVLNKASATDGASNYRFLHDRIQQAAHELLPDEERSAVHALIGKLQLEKGLDEGAGIVPITDHLIAGRQHLDQDLLHKLHDLGLRAARRTKTASAQQAALYYLDVAEEALRDSVDIPPPELLFEIGLERAESAYLQDDTKLAESVADELLQGDLKPLDEVSVLELKMLLQTARLEYRDALKTGQRANALLGVKLPSDPGVPNVMRQLASTKLTLRGMTDRDLLELPPM